MAILSFPSVFIPHDDHVPDPGAEIRAVRAQAAVVRSLLDELEGMALPEGGSGLGEAIAAQTVEELTQLAYRMVQAAAAIAPHRVVQPEPIEPGANGSGEPEPLAR